MQVAAQMVGASCKMSDLNDNRIALLERLDIGREPFIGLDVIYVTTWLVSTSLAELSVSHR